MSIFDNMSPGEISNIFDIGAPQYGTQAPNLWGSSIIEEEQFPSVRPEIPEPPSLSSGQSDMSGFASAGLTPPPLPPMQGMPAIPDMSRPAQAGAPLQNPGIQGMPQPGLANRPGDSTPTQNPDPMQQIGGLMSMALAGDPHKYAREKTEPELGALMQYLQQLGAV